MKEPHQCTVSSNTTARHGCWLIALWRGWWLFRSFVFRSDGASGDRSKGVAVRSRIGHSMLFHAPIDTKTNTRRPCLYIFAGQRNKDYLRFVSEQHQVRDRATHATHGTHHPHTCSDFYKYDITTDRFIEVSRDCSKQGGPGAGFTQVCGTEQLLDRKLCRDRLKD